jgi:hypothetical protein
MSNYDSEQKSELVKQHKRMAMGVPLTGQAMTSGKTEPKTDSKPKGGLTHIKPKK